MRQHGTPILKWCGGKRRLLSTLQMYLPVGLFDDCKYNTYIEPFLGGGSVAFFVARNTAHHMNMVLCDKNTALMDSYFCVRDNVNELVSMLKDIDDDYISSNESEQKEKYISYREKYNYGNYTKVERSALFMFLDKACFNGVVRFNSKGKFMVPCGSYRNTSLFRYKDIEKDSAFFKTVELSCCGYEDTEVYADERTFFYLDPPYRPLNETSTKTIYTSDVFGDEEQAELKKFVDRISNAGSTFVMSNSDGRCAKLKNDFFDDLYQGYRIERIKAPRSVGNVHHSETSIGELIITNLKA